MLELEQPRNIIEVRNDYNFSQTSHPFPSAKDINPEHCAKIHKWPRAYDFSRIPSHRENPRLPDSPSECVRCAVKYKIIDPWSTESPVQICESI